MKISHLLFDMQNISEEINIQKLHQIIKFFSKGLPSILQVFICIKNYILSKHTSIIWLFFFFL